jgi:alkylhydroperoxidase family enzyme
VWNNRALSYEVHACREGRWTVEAVLPEEGDAATTARRHLSAGAEEAKVVRVRAMPGGFATRKEILHERRPALKEPPLVVTGRPDGAPNCRGRDDLYGLASRQVMGRMLRMFLDRFQVTPTELLHNWTYARKLADTGTLMATVVFQVAQWQAGPGPASRERQRELQGLVDGALGRLRDFQAERRRLGLPPFDPEDPGRLARLVEARVGPGEAGFAFRFLLCQHLVASGSVAGKLEAAVELMSRPALDPAVAAMVEDVAADALGSADAVKDLLGSHANLGASLAALAGFLNGRGLPGGGTRVLGRIGDLIAEGRAPQCRLVLEERLLAELARDSSPLDRNDPSNDPRLLDLVVDALRTTEGKLLGGPRAETAVARRRLRLRQDHLRRLGLHDQADALGAEFRRLSL